MCRLEMLCISVCAPWLIFPQCNADLSWLLTDSACSTWAEINILSLIETLRIGSLAQRFIAGFYLGPSWLKAAAPAWLWQEPNPFSHAAARRGDRSTPRVFNCRWKSGMEAEHFQYCRWGSRLILLLYSPRSYWHCHNEVSFVSGSQSCQVVLACQAKAHLKCRSIWR